MFTFKTDWYSKYIDIIVIGVQKLYLTLNLLTTTIVAPPNNASKWQMGFNWAFKGLQKLELVCPRFGVD
jgi:hypothetical protein